MLLSQSTVLPTTLFLPVAVACAVEVVVVVLEPESEVPVPPGMPAPPAAFLTYWNLARGIDVDMPDGGMNDVSSQEHQDDGGNVLDGGGEGLMAPDERGVQQRRWPRTYVLVIGVHAEA